MGKSKSGIPNTFRVARDVDRVKYAEDRLVL
jgi:hypothetical protein